MDRISSLCQPNSTSQLHPHFTEQILVVVFLAPAFVILCVRPWSSQGGESAEATSRFANGGKVVPMFDVLFFVMQFFLCVTPLCVITPHPIPSSKTSLSLSVCLPPSLTKLKAGGWSKRFTSSESKQMDEIYVSKVNERCAPGLSFDFGNDPYTPAPV
jgi:hypothetical protein